MIYYKQVKIFYKSNGFTLVEMAIALVIIGLLLAGFLKYQALIDDSQVKSVITDLSSINGAIQTFHNNNRQPPGDIGARAANLPCVSTFCRTPGNGDGRINGPLLPGTFFAGTGTPVQRLNTATEGLRMLIQLQELNYMGLMEGHSGSVNPANVTPAQFDAYVLQSSGMRYPQMYTIYAYNHPNNVYNTAFTRNAAALRRKHYFSLLSLTDPQINTAGPTLISWNALEAPYSAQSLAKFDTKLDDGLPSSGGVRAVGLAGANECVVGPTLSAANNRYNLSQNGSCLGLLVESN